MFVFPLHVPFTLDYNSNSETKISRKFSLQEATEFCQKSSDEECDFDENVSEQELMIVNCTSLSMENQIINFWRTNKALTSEDKQSNNGDAEANELVTNAQFDRGCKKYALSSIPTSLDEVNYDMINFDNVEAKEVDIPLDKKKKRKLTWTTTKPKQNIRQASLNIIPNRPGIKPEFCVSLIHI